MSMVARCSVADRLAFRFFEAGGAHNLAGVVGGGLVQYRVLNGDQKLVVSSAKASGEWKIASLDDNPLADHIPELLLGDPVLLLIIADDEGGLLYFHPKLAFWRHLFSGKACFLEPERSRRRFKLPADITN